VAEREAASGRAELTLSNGVRGPTPLRIEGYAIISEDGMLATADRVMPESLIFQADQRFFEAGLDRASVIVHGRHSKENQHRSPERHRIMLTRRIAAIGPWPGNEHGRLWNPAGAPFEQALAALAVTEGVAAIIGGPEVFDLFLEQYDVFYLTRAPDVRIPGGIPVFPAVPTAAPEDVLSAHGLTPGDRVVLDAARGLIMVPWRRA
jgi:dihydrofolate reductase